jgi:hypothetical protein
MLADGALKEYLFFHRPAHCVNLLLDLIRRVNLLQDRCSFLFPALFVSPRKSKLSVSFPFAA